MRISCWALARDSPCLSSALLRARQLSGNKFKRTVTSRVDYQWETVFPAQGRRKVLDRGLQQGTSGRFTTRTEGLCTVQQKAIVQCPLVFSWGC